MLNILLRLLLALPGAIFGAAVGFWLVVETRNPIVFFGVIGITTVLGSSLSLKYGLDFWDGVGKARWLPWL